MAVSQIVTSSLRFIEENFIIYHNDEDRLGFECAHCGHRIQVRGHSCHRNFRRYVNQIYDHMIYEHGVVSVNYCNIVKHAIIEKYGILSVRTRGGDLPSLEEILKS